MSQHTIAISLSLIIGCAAGAATTQLVVPKARAGTAPTRWEYLCKDDLEKADQGLDAALNALGAEGWELVSASRLSGQSFGYHWATCFKRALP